MYKGTTPTFTLTLPQEVDLTTAQNVYVTFEKGKKELRKTGNDLVVTAHQVEVYLSQEETLSFPSGDVALQLNWTYQDGGKIKRAASNIVSVSMKTNLEDRVLD